MTDGNWPHGPNFYAATQVRHFSGPGRPPPIGLPAAELGLAPGTPVTFGGPVAMGRAQMALAAAQTPPAASLTEAGACPGRRPNPCEAAQLRTVGMGPRGITGVHPAAVPYVQAGERPPAPWSDAIQALPPEERESYAVWWNRYYTADAPLPTPEPAAPPPTVLDTMAEPPLPVVPTTVVVPPPGPPEPAPERKPWAWIIGGTVAAGALVAGGVYLASRAKLRRRRG